MRVKPLFKSVPGETYTEQGNALDMELTKVLHPIIQRCAKQGYSIRDVSYVINSIVSIECSVAILERTCDAWKASKKLTGA